MLANALDQLSIVQRSRDDLEGAEASKREAISIYRKLLEPDHPTLGTVLAALGSLLRDRGKLEEAEPLLADACRIFSVKLGPAQPDTLLAMYDWATLLDQRGSIGEANRVARSALDAGKETLADGQPYEWVRHALSSLIGSLLVQQSGAAAQEARSERLREAEALLVHSAEQLATVGGRLGPMTRRVVLEAALQRVVHLYEQWNSFEPGPGHQAKLDQFRAQLEQVVRSGIGGR